MTRPDKTSFIKERVDSMTLEQKVGQCLVLGFVGPLLTPEILHRIHRYYPSGVRASMYWRTRDPRHDPGCTPPEFFDRVFRTPVGTSKDFLTDMPVTHCTAAEYCGTLNAMKRAALENGLGLPLHITFDHEGDQSADFYHGGLHQTPNAMGLVGTKDPKVVYDVHKAVGDQYRPVGFGWTHSLVLDVNTNPMNPEISVRAFGTNPDDVIEYAMQAYRGWRDAGIISTGKHFPGRGESVSDAHSGLPYIQLSRDELEPHLEPYRALIAEGLPAIMTAHTAYPKIEPEDVPATMSKRILTGILKDELGFEGCITTDAMAMGGIVSRFEMPDACIRALDAGADLLLIRDEGGIIHDIVPALVRAVEEGELPIERIEDANRRTLGVKYDYGFFDEPSPVGVLDENKADEGINDPHVIEVITDASNRVVEVIRDEQNLLPIKKETNVLLVEQVNPLHAHVNTMQCHPSLLWTKMLQHSDNVAQVECDLTFTEEDRTRIKARWDEADIVVTTNYYGRRHLAGNEFVKEMHTWGKPMVVVTNSPYSFTVDPAYGTVICTYGPSIHCLEAAARVMFGE